MALIRIRGNREGIVNYLKKGLKSGRAEGRDDLDERIFLRGDIDQLDNIINSITASRMKYTNITIGFAEDNLDQSTLTDILNFYESHIFSAFRKEEYYLYAEAHLPIIKSTVNENGELKIRKPHIHIVIPNINLITGSSVNPWGGVYLHHEDYFDAIQEAINIKFGLASPKDNPRTNFTTRSSLLEAEKGDIFLESNINTKEHILDCILKNNICSTDEFRSFLRTIGEQKTRNAGRQNGYEAIKIHGTSRYINLRHFMFSKDFLQLTPQDKIIALKPKDDDYYQNTLPPREIPLDLNSLLEEWCSLRSKQIKYIDGNFPSNYKSWNKDEKILFLENKEREYYLGINFAVAKDDIGNVYNNKKIVPSASNPPPPRTSIQKARCRRDSAISQLIKNRTDRPIEYDSRANVLVPQWNASIDINFLLNELVYSHRLIRKKYRICGEETGEPTFAAGKINCGRRNLSVSDFLRIEMHMPWPVALDYMRQTMERQSKFVSNIDPQCGVPDADIWLRFRKNRSVTQRELKADIKQCMSALSISAADAIAASDLHRSFERFTMYQIKMPHHVRKLLLDLSDAQYFAQKSHVAADLRQNRQQLKSSRLEVSSWNLYLAFLHKNAAVSPRYLEELRKHSGAHELPTSSLHLAGRPEAKVNDIILVRSLNLDRSIEGNGNVIYKRNGIEFIRDEGPHLIINKAAGASAIRAAYILADQKWGKAYVVRGPQELQRVAHALFQLEASTRGANPLTRPTVELNASGQSMSRHNHQ